MIYAIDFDGVLADNAWPGIGPPKQPVIDYCKRLKQDGHKLILWTCREGDKLREAVAWCAEHGLTFDAVNENLPEQNELYGNDSRKIGADVYIDDKALKEVAE
jgi:hydroxymethylpyrimidine pyrophosphatase-like HAD family hydrolase